ncbi:thiamine pyrophosphokinase [Marinithermofilum abyssi]|uniref:Thiamine diphosphokinase n=1 Tax=Marinithermofilum abyssi TaxID=1571185 RepID=A0A8J2Y976_9BACL|nr:thiamine pyrophosphokinase [Marinithermofilum abyssi]
MEAADLETIRPEDRVIGVDGGARSLVMHGCLPDVAVGDFDTVGPSLLEELERKGVQVDKLPTAKDVTDTHYALEKALAEEPTEILLLGALGGARFDHALANVFLLEKASASGIPVKIRNTRNRMILLQGTEEVTLEREGYRYISLLALSDTVKGVTLKGFLYPLEDAVLLRDTPLGISNELVEGKGHIQIKEGKLLVIQSKD